MIKKSILLVAIAAFLFSCGGGSNNHSHEHSNQNSMNPFLMSYNTPFEVPPFDKIRNEHFIPAFEEGIHLQQHEIEDIVLNSEKPGFENTIAALDYSGGLLRSVKAVFFNLTESTTSKELEDIAKEISPKLSAHNDDILMNSKLFAKVKEVYENKESLNLTTEQSRLLDKTYKKFVRGGVNLSGEKADRFREINKRLSILSLKFGENVLAETNSFQLIIDNEEDLEGLPQGVIETAAIEAKNAGMEGKWIFTTQKPSMIPFLQYSEKRDLREKLHTAYFKRGDNGNDNDNNSIVSEMAKLRVERANLLGFDTHADFVLDLNMAKEPKAVYDFLDKLWEAALPMAKKEATEMQDMIYAEGNDYKLESWDWWYYAEKIKKAKYDLSEEDLKPYFELNNVLNGLFKVVNNLYGIQLFERTDIPKYHPDAHTFEVLEKDNTHIGILYMDFFTRESKRGGAWMDSFRKQTRENGENITPVITVVTNFANPTETTPSLLSFDDVSTLFHEFGHALHGLLSDCTYPSLSGTSVARDFVELPSQVLENWCAEPEVLKMFAKHYKTGEVIPDQLIKKLSDSKYFNQGFAAVEYMSAAYLDMDWHTISEAKDFDTKTFEEKSLNKIGLIPEIVVRYRSTYFGHIFSGGYSSGYYSYIWAELLDADAFQAFRENGIFDAETAKLFRDYVLSQGGTEDPMVLYKNFRGKEPSEEPLLKRKGFI